MKNVLITGGAGFIGSEIVKQLDKTGEWNITVLDSMTEQIHGKDWEKILSLQADRRKVSFCKGQCDRYQYSSPAR